MLPFVQILQHVSKEKKMPDQSTLSLRKEEEKKTHPFFWPAMLSNMWVRPVSALPSQFCHKSCEMAAAGGEDCGALSGSQWDPFSSLAPPFPTSSAIIHTRVLLHDSGLLEKCSFVLQPMSL